MINRDKGKRNMLISPSARRMINWESELLGVQGKVSSGFTTGC